MTKRTAVFLAFLALAAPLLALLHMALVPHYYNDSLGEWEHPRPGTPKTPPASAGLHAIDRETCRIFGIFLNQAHMWLLAIALVAVAAVLLYAAGPRPQSAPFDHKLTLAVAPKNSPPLSV